MEQRSALANAPFGREVLFSFAEAAVSAACLKWAALAALKFFTTGGWHSRLYTP